MKSPFLQTESGCLTLQNKSEREKKGRGVCFNGGEVPGGRTGTATYTGLKNGSSRVPWHSDKPTTVLGHFRFPPLMFKICTISLGFSVINP